MLNESRVPYWWDKVQPLLQQFSQRILIVADGGLNFNPCSEAGLSILVNELTKETPPPTITKAHRRKDPTADKQDFVFGTAVNTDNFDQVWLFGFEDGVGDDSVLCDAEIKVLSDFMDKGGGLFATGDHERLGYAMGGELPRVRKMRDWTDSPMVAERIDTVTNPGPDRMAQFDDQSDEIPQRIFPHYYKKDNVWSVHPLLRSPRGDIDVLPDHPHESVCLEGNNLNECYKLHGLHLVEFPLYKGAPLAPKIIATSISAGRRLSKPETINFKPPTIPKCFGAISIWDGHEVCAGRIVCDATWHHFVNINLAGTEAVVTPGHERHGLRDENMNFTEDFHQIAEYYRNIARWLIPSARSWAHWWIVLLIERYLFPLLEERSALPDKPKWEQRTMLGALVEDALDTRRGRGFTKEMITAVLKETLKGTPIEILARRAGPISPEIETKLESLELFIDTNDLRHGIVGSLFDFIARPLPMNPLELHKALEQKQLTNTMLINEAIKVVGLAIDAAKDYYSQAINQSLAVLRELNLLTPEVNSISMKEERVMANECEGRWEFFTLIPDKDPTHPVPIGQLEIRPGSGADIDGDWIDEEGVRTPIVSRTGKCRPTPNSSPDNISTAISFVLEMGGARYFFGGTFRRIRLNRFVDGTYYVIRGAPRAEPADGDTGTWGGSQGA